MVLKLSFSRSGIDPNTPTTTVIIIIVIIISIGNRTTSSKIRD